MCPVSYALVNKVQSLRVRDARCEQEDGSERQQGQNKAQCSGSSVLEMSCIDEKRECLATFRVSLQGTLYALNTHMTDRGYATCSDHSPARSDGVCGVDLCSGNALSLGMQQSRHACAQQSNYYQSTTVIV